jgi:hypothetical protein
MKIVIEKGQHQWFAHAEECVGLYRGLLVVGRSMDDVIDALPAAFKDLRDAASRSLHSTDDVSAVGDSK